MEKVVEVVITDYADQKERKRVLVNDNDILKDIREKLEITYVIRLNNKKRGITTIAEIILGRVDKPLVNHMNSHIIAHI